MLVESAVLVEAAEEYLNAGLSIIALSGKQPNAKVHQRGLNQPLVGPVTSGEDEALVRDVFTQADTTGIGIVLTRGLVVVDIDGEEGARVFTELVGEEAWKNTATASTGRGLHLYFLRFLETRTTKLGDKLDLKGVGGYVAAPPSLHPSGSRYEWLVPLVRAGRICADWLPDEVEMLLRKREEWKADFSPAYQMVMDYRLVGTTLEPYDAFTIDKAVAMVLGAKEGERNNVLNVAAFVSSRHGISLKDVTTQLQAAAISVGLNAQEARQTIRSAYRGKHG